MKNLFFTLSLACFITGSLFAQGQELRKKYSDPIVKQRVDSLIYKVDRYTGNYVNEQKSEFTYNNDQLVTSSLNLVWEEGTWVNSWIEDYTYNSSNLVETMVVREWISPDWENLTMYERIYNPDNTLKTEIVYFWDYTDQWDPSLKREYTYSEDSIVEGTYILDNEWRLTSFITYYYTNGVLTSDVTSQIYDVTAENFTKSTYTYTNGELTQKLISEWDGANWEEPYSKDSYSYDSYNNPDYYSSSAWDNEISAWNLREDSDPEYNNLYTRDDLIIPFFFEELYFRHMLVSSTDKYYYYYPNIESYLITYYYSPVIIQKAINNITDTSGAYPNPANEIITFTWTGTITTAELTVYSPTGLLINSYEINKNTPVPVNELKPGLYLYTIRNNGTTLGQGKFVVK